MSKYYHVHTMEVDKKKRQALILRITDEKASVMLHNYGRDRRVLAKEIQENDLEKIMNEYGVPKSK